MEEVPVLKECDCPACHGKRSGKKAFDNFQTPPRREQAEGEREFLRAIVKPLHTLKAQTYRLVAGTAQKAPGDVLEWGPMEELYFQRYMNEYMTETVGGKAPERASWQVSDAAVPQNLVTQYRVGVGYAAEMLDLGDAAAEAARRSFNEGQFLRSSFDRLSDRGWGALSDVMYRGSAADVPKWLANPQTVQAPGVEAILRHGITTGRGSIVVARDCSKAYDQYERWEFERLARTETAFALNNGTVAELEAHGFVRYAGTPEIPYHPNCFPGFVRILAPCPVNATRAWYCGKLLELTLANGTSCTVTVNHPILTDSGFVAAQYLRVGCDIVSAPFAERTIGEQPNDDWVPPSIEEVFHSFGEAFGVSTVSVPAAPEHFYGDGRFCQGDVDVVWADGLLGYAGEATVLYPTSQSDLTVTDVDGVSLNGSCCLRTCHEALATSPDCIVGRCGICQALFGGELAVAEQLRLMRIAELYSDREQPSIDGGAGNTVTQRKSQSAFPSGVELSQLVSIKPRDWAGHVYDLQTCSGLIIAGGVVTSNCMCSWSIDTETGRIVYSVRAAACELCQELLAIERLARGADAPQGAAVTT